MDDIFDVLEAEQNDLSRLLSSLDDAAWDAPSLCEGWTVADVVLHLAQTEEGVVATTTGGGLKIPVAEASSVDDMMDRWVASERGAPGTEVLARWEKARGDAIAGLRSAPDEPMPWAAAPLKPKTLATTRLSEHWIHAHDIADPLGLDYPDTDRLHNVARLAHRTISYAYMRAGRDDPPTVYLRLESPNGDLWEFGEPGADVTIEGPAGEFCRVAARRLPAGDAKGLRAEGDRADELLELVRTYA